MSGWIYYAYRLDGGGGKSLLDADLPLEGVSLTSVISGPAGHSSTINPAYQRLVGSDKQPLIQAYSTAIFAEHDGVIRNGCIVTDVSRVGAQLGISGVGFSGYLKGKNYDGEKFFVETDPLDIARHLWDHLQARKTFNIGVQLDRKTLVGKLIGIELDQVEFDTQEGPVSFESGPYKLSWWETDDMGSNFDDLATEHGFDYVESHAWNADRSDITSRIDFGAPRIGRRRDDLRFVVGENILVPPTEAFATDSYASEVLVRGAGEGRTMVRGYAANPATNRIGRTVVVEDKNLKSTASANARAQTVLASLKGAWVIPEASIINTTNAPLGSWVDGDEIYVQNDTEWGNSGVWYRVISSTITPADLSVIKVALIRADMLQA